MNSNKPFKISVDSKKITSIILTAIMLLSVFSGISASVVGNNNRVNDDVANPVGGEGVGATAVGSLAASLNASSPSANIANESAVYTNVFWIRFTASGESANLTSMVITEAGTIHGTSEIVGVGINDTSANVLARGNFSGDNGTITLSIPAGYEVPVGTLKDIYVWVNTTTFNLGDTLKMTLTSFNATGLASGQAVTTTGVPLSSNEIAGTGKLTLSHGPSDIAARTINAGANTTGTVLAQYNFSTTDIEGCTLNTIMLTESGTANGTKDFSAIYIVNDTDSDGVWDSNEPILGTPATVFSRDNGTATISGISKAITKGSWISVLAVVNTTSYFWSGDTLAVTITNATDVTGTGATSGASIGTYNTHTSNDTTGIAKIQVAAGAKQPYLNYVLEGQRAVVENTQLNFTAIAGQVNITQLTLEQAVKTDWYHARDHTFPRIYIDEDNDGNITAFDTPINLTAWSFTTNNLTMATYNTALSGTNFSDYGKLENGTHPNAPMIHIITLQNDTFVNDVNSSIPVTWWYTVDITYVNDTHDTGNTTRFNMTNASLNDNPNGTWWTLPITDTTEHVRDITAITLNQSHNVSAVNFEIVADSCVVDVALNTNITVGSKTETTAGQASKQVILAVCTTAMWVSGNHTKVVPNTITKYGNFSNYVAYDNTTGVIRTVYQSNDPLNTSVKTLGAVATGAVSSPVFWVKLGDNTPVANVGKSTNLAPVLQLTFEYGGTVDGLSSSTVYLRELIVSTNGTINEANNITACLVVDTNGDGAVSANEAIAASVAYTSDNQTIRFVPSSPIQITVDNTDNVTAQAIKAHTHVLVAFNTSSSIVLGETVRLYLDNTSVDYIADMGTMAVVNSTIIQILGNDLKAAGSITATRTNAILDGTVSDRVSQSYVPLMQLKFAASTTEAVNVTGINVTWNGTGNGFDKTSGIGIINDTNMNGVWDTADTELVLNSTAKFDTDNVARIDFASASIARNITIPAGGSTYVLLYVNTSATGINTSDTIAVNLTAVPFLNYSANGTTSGVQVADLQTTVISSAEKTAVWTGSMSVLGYNLTDHTWVEGAQTNFPVLALNFSAANETANIGSIILTANGTANESGAANMTVKLVEDVAPYGTYESETVLATGTFSGDNGTVQLTPSTAIEVVGGTSTYVLVIADITANIQAGTSIGVALNNPSTDYNATGYYSGARIQDSSTALIQNTTWSTGAITVSLGANNTITGAVDARNQTYVEVMQLNFSATPNMEDVVIWGINLSFLGTDAYNDTWSVGIINDWNENGLVDPGTDVELGTGVFDVNGTALIRNFNTNLTVNGTSGELHANNDTFNNTIIYVNTTNTFNVTDTLQIRLNSYNATGAVSGQLLTDSGVTQTSNTLTGTGNVTVFTGAADLLKFNNENISAGANTSVVVWQFRADVGTVENVTINSIDITEGGTADAVQDILGIYLVNDTDVDGKWNTSLGDSGAITNVGTFSSDNGRVTLTLTANNTITTGNSANYLLVVDVASTFYEGETLMFLINRSTTNGEPTRLQGVTATGATSGVTVFNNFTASPTSNSTVGYASINLYDTTQTTVGIYNETATNKEVLRLNFSAPLGAVNISAITLKENGTARIATGGISAVTVWYNGQQYNTTNSADWTENGTLTLDTYLQPGCGMIVNGTTNEVTITVNTSTSLVTGQTIVFEVNTTLNTSDVPPTTQGYFASGNVSVRAPNSTARGNISNSITVQGAAGQISFVAGWNFISIPKKQDTTMDTFGELLSGIDFSVAYTYSPSTGWTQVTSGDSVQVLYGYWVYVNTPGTAYLSYLSEGQTVPASRALTGDAWNAIGFSNTTATTANATLASVRGSWSTVIGWNAATQSYDDAIIYLVNDNVNMNPYEGYWLWMTQDDTLSAISA